MKIGVLAFLRTRVFLEEILWIHWKILFENQSDCGYN